MSDDRSKLHTLARILDGFNAHDLDAIMAHFADDAVFLAPRGPEAWGRRYDGKAAVREGLGARFAGIPDVRYEDRGHVVAGERGISEWTLSGTTTDGVALEVHGCDVWTFRGDEIVVKDAYWKIVEP